MHLISARQFTSAEQLDKFFNVYCFGDIGKSFTGKIMATIFYEPSTRTRFSFEAAMHNLGGNVISESNSNNLSVTKGESLEDTIRTVGSYCNVIVLRHPEKGSVEKAARVSEVPVINAGDGAGEHPTQALLDVYTIRKNLFYSPIALVCGDLLNGRTVHSLLTLLSLYPKVRIVACSPRSLSLPSDIVELLKSRKVSVDCYNTLEEGLTQKPNIVYMTRLQKEKLPGEAVSSPALWNMNESVQWNDFCLTPKLMEYLDKEALVLHPLPRNEELSVAIDEDPRCVYFTQQVRNGLRVRMGLLYSLFSNKVCYSSAL